MEKRRVAREGGGSGFDLLVGFIFYLFGDMYIEEDFTGFFPLGFSLDKYLCSFCMVVLVYLSVILFIFFFYENVMNH